MNRIIVHFLNSKKMTITTQDSIGFNANSSFSVGGNWAKMKIEAQFLLYIAVLVIDCYSYMFVSSISH
jgi:hypothetical protein